MLPLRRSAPPMLLEADSFDDDVPVQADVEDPLHEHSARGPQSRVSSKAHMLQAVLTCGVPSAVFACAGDDFDTTTTAPLPVGPNGDDTAALHRMEHWQRPDDDDDVVPPCQGDGSDSEAESDPAPGRAPLLLEHNVAGGSEAKKGTRPRKSTLGIVPRTIEELSRLTAAANIIREGSTFPSSAHARMAVKELATFLSTARPSFLTREGDEKQHAHVRCSCTYEEYDEKCSFKALIQGRVPKRDAEREASEERATAGRVWKVVEYAGHTCVQHRTDARPQAPAQKHVRARAIAPTHLRRCT
jgi:hypothetical protein